MHDAGADLAVIVLKRAQEAMPIGGKMRQWMAVGPEHVMIEKRFPGFAFWRRAFADRDHRQQEARIWSVRARPEGVPPIIDETIERGRRLHLMPPELW